MNNLLTFNYWLNLRPEALSSLANQIFIIFLVLLTASSILFFTLKNRPSLYRFVFKKLYNFSISNLIIGLLLLFFNYESAIFFSARFWFLVWLIIMIIWLIFIGKELKKIPARKKKAQAEEAYRKYLP